MSAVQYTSFHEFVQYMKNKYGLKYCDEFYDFVDQECELIKTMDNEENKINYLKIKIEMWILEKDNAIYY
jgi:hypothetical protein